MGDARNGNLWRLQHSALGIFHPLGVRREAPAFPKQHQMPVLGQLSCHIFILAHAIWPALVPNVYSALLKGSTIPAFAVVFLYSFAYGDMILREAKHLQRIGER